MNPQLIHPRDKQVEQTIDLVSDQRTMNTHRKTRTLAVPGAIARGVLSLVGWVLAGTTYATEPIVSKPATSSFSEECTTLAGEDLVLMLTPACTAQLGTDAGKQAFQELVQSEMRSLERRKASNSARSARANLTRLGHLSAMDGNQEARRAANYATRQAAPLGGANGATTIYPPR